MLWRGIGKTEYQSFVAVMCLTTLGKISEAAASLIGSLHIRRPMLACESGSADARGRRRRSLCAAAAKAEEPSAPAWGTSPLPMTKPGTICGACKTLFEVPSSRYNKSRLQMHIERHMTLGV